jgi:hypothetical protein
MRLKGIHFAVALFAAFAAIMLLITPTASAQNVYGTIRGTVTDPSGAVVTGATVTITNDATGIVTSIKTDSKGTYVFPEVQPGTYVLVVSASGFNPSKITGLAISVNTIRQENIKLKIGSSQTVQVSAAGIQIQTSDTQLKSTYQSKEIEALPLLGRNVVSLQKNSPGVVESSDRFGTFSTNGSQTAANAFLLDGADINDAPLQSPGIVPNPDAISEFQVVVSTLNPQYSRNSGAIVLEQLKTGTNQFHGDAFEFYRDAGLDTRNYFSLKPSPLHQNIYGGTLGGPVFKNKLFFFLAYQGMRNKTSGTQQTTVFSNAQRQGAFGNETLSSNPIPFPFGNCTTNETWAQCFPNGVNIAPSDFNPLAAKLMKDYVPEANNGPYYRFNTANKAANDQGIIRIDYHPDTHDILWASSIFQSNPTTASLPFIGANLPGFGEIDSRHVKIFNASWTHIINPTTVNELRANYFRFNFKAVAPQNPILPSSYGFTGITPQNTTDASLPYMGVQGYFTLGFSADGPQPRNDQTLQGSDNLSKVIGNHNMRFGVQAQRYSVNNPFYFVNNGYFSFDPSAQYSSGDPAIDFLMGIPSFFEQSSGGFINARAWEVYAYAQDNWKYSDTLTFNYGTGYDVETPWANFQYSGLGVVCYSNSDYQSKIFPGVPGLKYPGDPGCNNMVGPTTKYTHLAPRVGLAWAPKEGPKFLIGEPGSQSFSVRAGFGVYYNRDQEEGSLQNLLDPPFGLFGYGYGQGNYQLADPYHGVAVGDGSVDNPFPFVPPTPGSGVTNDGVDQLDINGFADNNTTPIIYNFNLNVQRALPGAMIMQVGYVGSIGHHLVITYEGNPITTAGHDACLASSFCRQAGVRAFQRYYYPGHASNPRVSPAENPYYLSVGTQATEGVSNYNSLQVKLTKRPTHGLYFTLAYTYSHALDNGSGLESSGFNGHGYNQYPGYAYLNYGDSDYDARHRFVAVYEYQIPIGARLNRNYFARLMLGGWNLGGITTLQTGFPINIFEGGTYASLWCTATSYYSCPDTPNTSTFNIPTKVASPNEQGFKWMDTSVFSPEKVGYFGNVKRGILHGPGYNYTNMDLLKNFYLNSARNLYFQLRLEAYNVFNHPNFASPDGNYSDGPNNFGVINSVKQPGINGDPQPGRTVQLAGKFYF